MTAEPYVPAVGDRVSLTATVVDIPQHTDGLVAVQSPRLHRVLVDPAHLALVERPKPAEDWQPGDVVRDADTGPEDTRTWFCFGVNERAGGWMAANGRDLYRESLPVNLRLLVRDGQPVAQPAQHPQPQPQPGDVITDEPPVGSVVADYEGDTWKRLPDRWSLNRAPRSGDWDDIGRPRILVRWGSA